MKSYKEISEDIESTLSENISGIQLDVLTGILSMYVYEVQTNAVSQLLEGNIDTAINVNSVISKAAQYGVSCPRVRNPEVEFEVTSTNASYELTPGMEVISIGKFKFLYLGYISDSELVTSNVTLNSTDPILVRCLVTDKVTTKEVDQIPGEIYNMDVSNVSNTLFVYKNGQSLRIHESYADYLRDLDSSKMTAVTYPDYGVKLVDEVPGDISHYKVIYPNGFNSLNDIVGIIKGNASTSNVLVSSTRLDGTQNIKITYLGNDKLDMTNLVPYVELNLKRTQLIKSNTDIVAFFTEYLLNTYGSRYNVNYQLSRDLIIYVSNKYFTEVEVNELIPMFYVGLNSIVIKPGSELNAKVNIELNNQLDSVTSDIITSYVTEYDYKFNTTIDEYDLISKINSVNSLIHLTEFKVLYSTLVEYDGVLYTVKLSEDNYDEDVPNLEFTSTPDTNKVYKLYLNKSMYIKTDLVWL